MIRSLVTSLACGLLLCSCGEKSTTAAGKGDSAPAAKSKGTIGLSVLTMTNPFFKTIADTMTAEAAKQGFEVLVVSGEMDPLRQHNQIKDFISRRCAAIVLNPCDSKAVGSAIQEANAAGIPVLTADIACLDPNVQVVSHIATDNYGGGKEAARGMIEALGDAGGRIAVLNFEQAESCILRVKGFKEVIAEHNNTHPDKGRIDIVKELPCGGSRNLGMNAAEDALNAHPDLAGIFAINDPSALGARAALEKAGKTNVKLIGFDGQPDGMAAIKEGKIYADPVQYPDEIGRKTLEAIIKYLGGEKPPKEILIPTKLIRQKDA